MAKHTIHALLLTLACAQAQETTAKEPSPISEQEWAQLHATIQPAEAAWLQIPWHTDLLEARQQAIEQKRPLFLWSMNGHPLGCT